MVSPKDFPTATGTRILRILLNTEGLIIPQIAERMDANEKAVPHALESLEVQGYVKRHRRVGQGHAYLWLITPYGQMVARLAADIGIGG